MEKINVPNPCSEKWELMSPQEKGRFCSACNKCVIDFTQMQPQEIRQIIDEKQGERVCGRFYNHQLSSAGKYDTLKNRFFNYIPSGFQHNKMILSVFSILLFLAGCSKQKTNYGRTTGIVVSETQTDTLHHKGPVRGESKISEKNRSAEINKQDRISAKK